MHGPRNRPVQASDAVYGPDFVKTCTDQTPLESGASVLFAPRLEPPEPFPLPSPARFSRSLSEPSRASRHRRAIQNLPTATAHRCNEIEAREPTNFKLQQNMQPRQLRAGTETVRWQQRSMGS